MDCINELFSEFPTKKMDLYQGAKSASGKTKADTLTVSGVNLYIDGDSSNLAAGIVAGTTFTAYVDGSELDEGCEYKTIGYLYQKAHPEFQPFWKLNLERTKIA